MRICHHGATLGQRRAGQGRPHGNLTEPYGYLIGPHGTFVESSNQAKPCKTKPNFTKMGLTLSFLKLQAPDFSW